MKFYRILFENAKTHFVGETLKEPLVAEMIEREHPPKDLPEGSLDDEDKRIAIREVTEWGIDLGGSCLIGQPEEVIHGLWGLQKFDIWSDHVGTALAEWTSAKLRTFATGEPYYKFHGRWHALVLTPDQADELIFWLMRIYPSAERRANAHVENWKREMAAKRAAESGLH